MSKFMATTSLRHFYWLTVVCNKKYERERSIDEIAEVLRKELDNYPEIIDYQCTVGGVMRGMVGGSSTVDVEIYGYDFAKTSLLAEKIKRMVSDSIPGARDINVDRDDDRAELKIVVDKEKIARQNLNSVAISSYVRNRVNGMAVGYLKEDGDEYNIVVRLQEENRNTLTDIQDLTIPTPMGKQLNISIVTGKQIGRAHV